MKKGLARCKYVICFFTVIAAALVWSHSGGLNSEGCHNNRKTGDYHRHRQKA